jgi:hypothetical protein
MQGARAFCSAIKHLALSTFLEKVPKNLFYKSAKAHQKNLIT